jgi:hypothetical protein
MGRETVLDHPFGSWRARKVIMDWAVIDSIAELLGIVTVYTVAGMETGLAYAGREDMTCTVIRCHRKTVDSDLLSLYGVILMVRILVLVWERSALLRMVAYYQRKLPSPEAPSRRLRRVMVGTIPLGRRAVGGSRKTFRLQQEICTLLGDENSGMLLVAVFVLVMAYASAIRNGF